MPNNELFYRVAREALADDTISALVDDLAVAVDSYLAALDEDGSLSSRHVREEIELGHRRAVALVDNLRAWRESV